MELIDNGGTLLVRSTDGTQFTYAHFNREWRCTQIKDRNGNYKGPTMEAATIGWRREAREGVTPRQVSER